MYASTPPTARDWADLLRDTSLLGRSAARRSAATPALLASLAPRLARNSTQYQPLAVTRLGAAAREWIPIPSAKLNGRIAVGIFATRSRALTSMPRLR